MKVLITGVAGLIGSRFAKWLIEHTGHSVVGVDDLSCGLINNIPQGLDATYVAHIGSGTLPRIFEMYAPEVVYHFAAHAAECMSPFARCHNYQENLVATAEVVNCCVAYQAQRLVFTSSMAVYGRGNAPFSEVDHCYPIDPYGVAKLAAEMDIWTAGDQHGLDWCIVRPHNVYGPGQSYLQPYRNVLSIWLHRYTEGLPLLVYGDGTQRRAFSYIDDCLEPLFVAGFDTDARHEIFNLGGTQPITINEAVTVCAKMLPGATVEHREPRYEVWDAWCTWDKSERILGYRDTWDLERGVAELWGWMKDKRALNRPVPLRLELTDGLYSYWQTGQG